MNLQQSYSADVLITAGATIEPVDNVRFVSNFSTGKLGHALAKTYRDRGHKVLLFAPKLTMELYGTIPGITHIRFTSAKDLEEALQKVVEVKLAIHSAAVSDYTPAKKVNGKISSDQDKLVIELDRTPKILAGMREQFGRKTKIVGFKLLSDVAEADLISVAQKQIIDNCTDLCVANDLKDVHDRRKVHIVQRDGSYTTLTNGVQELAVEISQSISLEAIRVQNTVLFR